MPQLMFPDIAGATLQGFQQGQQMRANRLVGAAMQNPDDAQGYLAQAGAIDPRLALGVQGAMQQQQAQQAQTQQAQQDMVAKKLRGAALYAEAALNSGDQGRIAAAQATLAPYLKQLTGKDIGPLDDPSTKAAMDQVLAQTAYLDPNATKAPQPYTLSPGGQRYDGNNKLLASAPVQPKITAQGYQAVLGPDGTYHAESIPIQGAPNGVGMGQAASGATPGFQGAATSPNGQDVTFNFPPGTPPEVIAAAKASAVANGDLAPGQQIGAPQAPQQPATLAQAVAGNKQVATLTPEEVAAAGLPKGTVAQRSPDGAIHVVSKPGGQDGEPLQFGDATKTGQDYLATLDPQIASQVKALDEGRMQFPSSFALKTPYWQGMLSAVSRYDPSFDAVNYNTRSAARKAFTSGKEAQQVNALNTVAQHLAQLQGYAQALDNTSFPLVNKVKNAASGEMGSPNITNFNRTVLPVAQELERVWRGTGGTEGDIKQWVANLSSASSPAQFKDAFEGLTDLIHGKLAALRDQYVQGMGTTANPYRFLSPQTQAIFSHLDSVDAGQFANEATAGNNVAANSPQSGAPAPGTIEQGYRFKGGDPSNQANWEPVQ